MNRNAAASASTIRIIRRSAQRLAMKDVVAIMSTCGPQARVVNEPIAPCHHTAFGPVARRAARLSTRRHAKLIIGNKAYSSWSLRGWLACKQSGLPFEEVVVPLYDADWDKRREGDEFAPPPARCRSCGTARPWCGTAWRSSEYLAEKTERAKFWPEDDIARADGPLHGGRRCTRASLRRAASYSMNIRQVFPPKRPDDDVLADIGRIMELWAQARARFGGTGELPVRRVRRGCDMMFAPVVTRPRHLRPADRALRPRRYGREVLQHPLHAGLDRRRAGRGMGDRAVRAAGRWTLSARRQIRLSCPPVSAFRNAVRPTGSQRPEHASPPIWPVPCRHCSPCAFDRWPARPAELEASPAPSDPSTRFR